MAAELANSIRTDPPCPPSNRLYQIMINGLQNEKKEVEYDENPGIDLEFQAEGSANVSTFFFLKKKNIINVFCRHQSQPLTKRHMLLAINRRVEADHSALMVSWSLLDQSMLPLKSWTWTECWQNQRPKK